MNLHIKDNLNYLYNRVQTGTVTITPSGANTPTSQTVTFPVAFASTPYVIVSLASTVPGTVVTGIAGDNETTTTCRVTITRTNTTATVVRWTAFIP